MLRLTVAILAGGLLLGSATAGKSADLLFRPDGSGPFPAVVLMHGCGGVLPLYSDWSDFLKTNGYVSLVVDSLGPRGLGPICANVPLQTSMAHNERIDDAYAALAYLKTLPFVDGQRIALMGWSHGAWVALEAGARVGRSEQFNAVVAMYPWCRDSLSDSRVPSLILIGEYDDWTPAKKCEALKARVPSLSLKVYPATTHHFDDHRYARGIVHLGHSLQYNEKATIDARAQVLRFLGEHLGAPKP